MVYLQAITVMIYSMTQKGDKMDYSWEWLVIGFENNDFRAKIGSQSSDT